MAPVPTVYPAPLVPTHKRRKTIKPAACLYLVWLKPICPEISVPGVALWIPHPGNESEAARTPLSRASMRMRERLRDLCPRSRLPGQAATPSSCADNRRSVASLHERVNAPARKGSRGGSVFSADSFHDGGGRPQSPTVARIQSFFLCLVFHRAYRSRSRHCGSAALLGFRPGISCTA